jgi:hypothetical protein
MSILSPPLKSVFISGKQTKQTIPLSVSIAAGFNNHMSHAGWTLISDISQPPKLSAGSVQTIEFLKPDEKKIPGEILLERAQELEAVLGQRHAEALLRNQHLLEKWDKNHLIPFLGTIWECKYKMRRVCCLSPQSRNRWKLEWRWLDHRHWGIRSKLPKYLPTP